MTDEQADIVIALLRQIADKLAKIETRLPPAGAKPNLDAEDIYALTARGWRR